MSVYECEHTASQPGSWDRPLAFLILFLTVIFIDICFIFLYL